MDQIKSQFEDLPKIISELHQNEDKKNSLNKELTFFEERMKDKIPEKEVDEIRRNISSLVDSIVSTKGLIIENLKNFLEDITVPQVRMIDLS